MAKGKHIVVDGASDQDCNLEDDYCNLFDNNVDLEGEKDKVDVDGVAELDAAEIDGIEFDRGDFDGVSLDGDDLVSIERDGANLVAPNIDVPESSNSRRGVNMGARQNKRLKIRKGKIVVQYNEMGVPAEEEATELASFLIVLARTSVSILYSNWHKVPLETKERLWKSILGHLIIHPISRKQVIQSIGTTFRNFKYMLTKNYIWRFPNDNKKLYTLPIDYPKIKRPVWIKFFDERLSKSFEKISRVNKNQRALKKCNHCLSRKGYVGLMKEICAESSLSKDLIDRSELWKRARMLKN
ncbi:hypothetical protein AB3S75_020096 [Citrus x aurantiifolia]